MFPYSEQDVDAALARSALDEWFLRLNPTFVVAPHHAQIINALERVERGECKRLMVSVPPRHGKSELVSIAFPGWFIGRNPDKRVILASYGASLAHKLSRQARNQFSLHGTSVFGLGLADDSASVSDWDIAGHRGGLSALGVDGSATGKGMDLGIIDDPFKDMAEADSEVIRENVMTWYRSVFRTRLHPGGSMVIVQTRWHPEDLAGQLLKEAAQSGEQWEVLNLQMVDDATGEPLWPGRYAPEEIESIRTDVGSRVWEALYQGRPVAQEGGLFKRAWWRRYSTPPKGFLFEQLIQSWDLAFKDTKNSDFVVGQLWGRTRSDVHNAGYYLLDQVRGRMDFPATCAAIASMSLKWPGALVKLIEDKANGPAVITALRGTIDGIVAVNPEGGKESRASAVSPLVESGQVYLPNTAWADALIDECSSFPRGAHDDQVDALSQALLRLMRSEVKVMPLPTSTGIHRTAM